ncbi:MAG: histidine kinase [Flavobacteriaceae bacterium]|nr:histidine kinase [Bacteroidia bacterium]NNF75679.1 histidine kinase [Flavobacteriaceae bacterium]NNK73895.1 histidine kinase [Flavobacteriaceae bacterium]
MTYRSFYTCFLIFLCGISILFGQETSADKKAETFIIRGLVIENGSYSPIPNANIQVNGGAYTTTDNQGEFRIAVKLNDELIIKHSDFETVYHTISTNERITVKVDPGLNNLSSPTSRMSNYTSRQSFMALIDSADTYLKKDAEKSIQFITEALGVSSSSSQNADAYETLGDVYFHWNQYDLAITNFRISLQNVQRLEVQLKLANAFARNNNFQESLSLYRSMDSTQFSNWQKVIWFEGMGDVYYEIQDYDQSISSYLKGLKVAQDHLITPKVTDLNSKIAQTYDAMGSLEVAEDYFEKSLDLATQENKKRGLEEKVKVADFQNKSQKYEAEIQNRQEALNDIQDIESDSILSNESALTSQKQNYKIGNAYFLKNDFKNAIPYLEKSITEAEEREDLVVQKDATRKLSEVYRDAGDFDKAMKAYNAYIDIVDELYSRKEQEIIQAARFRQDLSDKQSRISSLESDRALSATKYELSLERNKRQQLIIYSLIGGVLLLLSAGYFMYKSIRQQKLANNLLALKSLRSQMNPHFIFNALNSVNSFIALNDERTANQYLSDFSLLMRAVLENSEEDFIPLSKEIELIELYARLEHFRFKDRFEYKFNIGDNVQIEAFKIPPMLLQPYIENAVWHGLRYKKEKGVLSINIDQQKTDEINITISDNGIGRERSKAMKTENQKKHNSKGLGNIKKRVAILNTMYKDKVDIAISDLSENEDRGTKVVVTLKKIK